MGHCLGACCSCVGNCLSSTLCSGPHTIEIWVAVVFGVGSLSTGLGAYFTSANAGIPIASSNYTHNLFEACNFDSPCGAWP